MSQRPFNRDCNRAKNAIAGSPMTMSMLALVLGIAPSEFAILDAKGCFPWREFAALALKFPELGIEVELFPEIAEFMPPGCAETKVAAPVLNKPIEIEARITRCANGQPLVVLPGRPFNGLEIYPAQLERFGETLTAIARLAKQHKGGKDTKVTMS